MGNHMHRDKSSWQERGSTALTVLCSVLGTVIALVGLLFIIMAISFAFDGEDVGLILFVLVIGAVALAGGVLLILLPHRLGSAQKKEASPQGEGESQGAGTFAHEDGSGVQVISRQVVSGPVAVAETAQAAPAQTTAQAAPQAAPQAHAQEGNADELANLVSRSDDVVATLKDFVRHEATLAPSPNSHLVSMLAAAGLMGWDDAPAFQGGRLTRNHHFWLRLATDGLTEEDYDRLVMVEAALNVNQDLGTLAATATVDQAKSEVPPYVMAALTRQSIQAYDLVPSIGAAYPATPASETPGEWAVRASFASAAECAVTPFRVVYDFRTNVAERLMVVSLELPRPRCMALFASDAQEQVAVARAYALRLSLLLAEQALALGGKDGKGALDTVVVNGHERGSDEVLLSVRFAGELPSRMRGLLEDGSALLASSFPTSANIRAQFGADGWFEPVEPFLGLDDELVSPAQRFGYPELSDQPTSERLRAVTGARTASDLGINENAARIAAWDRLSKDSWQTTSDAMAALVAERDATEDIPVIEACTRTMDALLAGTVDATDSDALSALFVGDTALDRAVRVAEAALDETDGPSDPDKAIQALSEALSPINAVGAYLDDSDTIYRYFGSVAERICFDLNVDDHRRRVVLVPDAYYNALSNLSIAQDELGQSDEALKSADEMVRIAPTSIHAVMRKVRVLEHQSRIYEAADLIKAALRMASTPRDAAICQYRLAYMEWKLGREDLAVACYQRALTWDTEMSANAREELDDLLSSSDKLRRLSDDEACNLLAREGIPLGCDESDRRRLLAAAVLCCDEGLFWSARALVAVLFNMSGDDVLMGVYRSLAPKE